MQRFKRTGAAVATAAAVLAGAAGSASANVAGQGSRSWNRGHAVFVQTDNLAGNQVVAYDRAANGTLTLAGTYDTGGLGGQLTGSQVDHLASQGSLEYDHGAGLLYAVNAGSNSISVFGVYGDHLVLRQVLSSGGTFPVSIAVHGGLVYVANAENGGSVDGFWQLGGRLIPIPGSNRPLGLNLTTSSPSSATQFVNTPGQVAFSRDGSQLIVTTKANGDDIDVFHVYRWGLLSASPTVNPEAGTVPFGIAQDRQGNLVIAEAGASALATFALQGDGTVTALASVTLTGQNATCWVARSRDRFYASNAGGNATAPGSLSGVQSSNAGSTLTLLGTTTTDAGTVDAAATHDGSYLYVQTGAGGIVDEFAINGDGSLTEIGSVTVAGGTGGEGIVAS